MMGGRGMADADAAAQEEGHADPPAAHVLHLGNLVENLADRIENEVGEHEINDWPGAGHGGAAGQADKTPLRDGRVTEPLRPIEVKQPFGGLEVAAALADAFSQDEDGRVLGHLLRQGLVGGLHVGDFALAGERRG
jgi:hypothetical protein